MLKMSTLLGWQPAECWSPQQGYLQHRGWAEADHKAGSIRASGDHAPGQ